MTAVLCEHPSIQNGATVTVQYGRGKQQETATTLENHAGEVFHWKHPYLFFDIPEGCGFHRRIWASMSLPWAPWNIKCFSSGRWRVRGQWSDQSGPTGGSLSGPSGCRNIATDQTRDRDFVAAGSVEATKSEGICRNLRRVAAILSQAACNAASRLQPQQCRNACNMGCWHRPKKKITNGCPLFGPPHGDQSILGLREDHQCTPPFDPLSISLSWWSTVQIIYDKSEPRYHAIPHLTMFDQYKFSIWAMSTTFHGSTSCHPVPVCLYKSGQHLWCFSVRVDRRWACTLTRATIRRVLSR